MDDPGFNLRSYQCEARTRRQRGPWWVVPPSPASRLQRQQLLPDPQRWYLCWTLLRCPAAEGRASWQQRTMGPAPGVTIVWKDLVLIYHRDEVNHSGVKCIIMSRSSESSACCCNQ